MKANRAQVERALRAPQGTRLFLLHGPDEAGSRALAAMLAEAVGREAERIDLTGAELKADPARLPDEAAAISLFGGARWILVSPAGDETLPAVEALLAAPAAGNPVVLVAGTLKPSSKLLKLVTSEAGVMAFASYPPDAREAERMTGEMARARGLNVDRELARRIADACAGNRAAIAQELDKFALYLDAAPERPRPLEADTIALLGAGSEEGDLSRLVDSVGGGDQATLQAELLRLASEGVEGITLIRAMLRRMALLARLRAAVERGASVEAVMASEGKAVFFKEKEGVARQLARWRPDLIAKASQRLLEAERAMKAPGAAGPVAAEAELFAICRQAGRLR